jgi:hemerythrin
MEWSNVYSLGDSKVDTEHKKLFELANMVEKGKDNKQQLQLAVKELVRYTRFHFRSEENYMASFSYPNLAEHIEIHKHIVESLNILIKNMPNEPVEQIYKIIYDFVENGLVQHIIVEDKKVQHFKRNKLGLRAFFTWKDDYKLQQDEIDKEHKELFKIAIQALNYKNDADLKTNIKQVITKLNEYMKFHFEHEEEFMQFIGFPGLEEHKILHENIINQINELIKNISSFTLADFEKKLMTYIDIWLVNHIIFEDKKIMCYFQSFTIDFEEVK